MSLKQNKQLWLKLCVQTVIQTIFKLLKLLVLVMIKLESIKIKQTTWTIYFLIKKQKKIAIFYCSQNMSLYEFCLP